MKIIIGSHDPSFNPIELETEIKNRPTSTYLFEKEYYDINDEKLYEKLYSYAFCIIGGRWKKAEPIIMQNPHWAYYYARYIIGGRWPEAEPIIKKDVHWSYTYALYIIRGRWPEAEPTIEKDAEHAYHYAKYVIGGRWKEAEPHIKKNPIYGPAYRNFTKCEL